MINCLMIFGSRASKRVELPPVTMQKWEFLLEKDMFGLDSDLIVGMTVLDNRWCFAQSTDYAVKRGTDPYHERHLSEGQPLTIATASGGFVLDVIPAELSSGIPVIDKYVLDARKGSVSVGSSSACSISLQGEPLLRDVHVRLTPDHTVIGRKAWRLEVGGACYVNGVASMDQQLLSYGDIIDIYGTRIVFLGDLLAVASAHHGGVRGDVALERASRDTIKWLSNIAAMVNSESDGGYYRPAPREMAEYDTDEVDIEAPPSPRNAKQRSLLSTIGPSLTMVLPMALGAGLTGMGSYGPGLIMMGGSAVGMAFWSAKSYRDQKRESREEERERQDKYRAYLDGKAKELNQSLMYNRSELFRMYPSASECADYLPGGGAIWNRNPRQDDYGFVRVGVGERETLRPIKVPQERFSLVDDDLVDGPKKVKDKYGTMRNVPVGIMLGECQAYGLVGGPDKNGCYPVLRAILAQIATSYAYSEMKIVLLCDGSHQQDRALLESVKWMPHVWSDDGSMRFAGDTPETRREVLNALVPELQERWELARGGSRISLDQRYVVVCTDPSMLEGTMASVYLLESSSDIATSTFICAEEFNELPNACTIILRNSAAFSCWHHVTDAKKNWHLVDYDRVSIQQLTTLSHRLASLKVRVPESQHGVPDMISFLDMYGVGSVEELGVEGRWRRNSSHDELAAPIGMAADDMLCVLDLHERAHGPHGLVAGTTGSGKSETLMTWILSLAVNYSPEDVCFLLIDYKGGGLVNQFEGAGYRLPHLAGSITNLAGNQIQRALVSINSENIRRQQLLTDAGANDIYDYAKLYQNGEVSEPLPHLIIVVDEFAELKKQNTEFMDKLISVATIGRSLGVHLVLATQRPEGVVDDRIASNSRFRLCLKVQTPQDSKSMLDRTDAAYVTQKGRGFLRVGSDELFQLFQSAWSRAPYPADALAAQVDVARMLTVTGRTELVGTHHIAKRREAEQREWAELLLRVASAVEGDKSLDDNATLQAAAYKLFAKEGKRVPQSSMNDERIGNLLRTYELSLGQNGSGEVTAERMVQVANNMGLKLPEEAKLTQIDAVVRELQRVADAKDLGLRRMLWLPELEKRLVPERLTRYLPPNYFMARNHPEEQWSLETCIGLFDDPEHQYQAPVKIDFRANGNQLILGSSLSGKSALLQTLLFTLIERYTPEVLAIYCIDFSAHKLECLEAAPHVGGVLFEEDEEGIAKLFFLLDEMLMARKRELHGNSFAQMKQTGEIDMPAVILAIDNYGLFSERSNNTYDATVLRYAKEGPGCGIYVVVTGASVTSGEVPSKLADSIKGRACLAMNDTYDYKTVLGVHQCSVYPCEGVPGRGLIERDGAALEFQTMLAVNAKTDMEVSRRVRHACERLARTWQGRTARAIPRIPSDATLDQFLSLQEVRDLLEDDRTLPIGYDRVSALPVGIDLSKVFCFLVSGKPNLGRRNFMPLLIDMAHRKGGDLYVFGTGKGLVKTVASQCYATYYAQDKDLEPFFKVFSADLKRRNGRKLALEEQGYLEDDLYIAMQDERRVFIFIEDLASFTQFLYKPSEEFNSVAHFFEVLADKAWYHQVFLFVGIDATTFPAELRGTAFYRNVVRDGTGIHFGGNVASSQIMRFEYLTFKEQNKTEPKEVGLIASSDTYPDGGAVVVPAVKVKPTRACKESEA